MGCCIVGRGDLGFRVWGLGLGFWVSGIRFGVEGLGFTRRSEVGSQGFRDCGVTVGGVQVLGFIGFGVTMHPRLPSSPKNSDQNPHEPPQPAAAGTTAPLDSLNPKPYKPV